MICYVTLDLLPQCPDPPTRGLGVQEAGQLAGGLCVCSIRTLANQDVHTLFSTELALVCCLFLEVWCAFEQSVQGLW